MVFCRLGAVVLCVGAVGCRDLALPNKGMGRVTGVAAWVDLSGNTVPAAGAEVTVAGSPLRATASSRGVFEVGPITSSAGQLTLRFDADGDGQTELARTFDFVDWNIRADRDTALGQVLLRTTATVTGTVLLADAGVDGNSGIEVFVPGQPLAALTSDTGLFILRGVPEGPLSLAASHPGYAGQRVNGLLATSGGLVTLAPLVLVPAVLEPTAVTGQLVAESAADLAETVVLAIDLAGAQALTVTAEGAIEGQVRPGRLTVVTRTPGYSDAVLPNLVASPGATLELGSLTLVRGTFSFDAGAPPTPPGAPRCGDGLSQPGETCDDGNLLPADGCSERCQLEPQPGGGGQWCLDAQVVKLSGIADGGLSAVVAVGKPSMSVTTTQCQPHLRTFAVTLPFRARLSLASAGEISLRGANCAAEELQCGEGGFTSGVLEAGRHVFGVESPGATTLQLVALPVAPGPYCGDGAVAPSETCDDGNPNAFDACDARCQLTAQPMAPTCGFAPLLAFAPVNATDLGAATQSADSTRDPTVQPSCFDGGTANNISRFTLTVPSDVRVETPQASRDVGLAVLAGTCSALVEEACTQLALGDYGAQVLSVSLDAGSYYLVSNSFGGAVETRITVHPR